MNSILAHIESNIDYKSSEVRQMLSHPGTDGKLLILVEGEDDEDFYRQYIDSSGAMLYTLFGCKYFANVLTNLNPRFRNRLAAIKDADFDHLNNVSYPHSNLFLTDCHDCEMMTVSPEKVTEIAKEYKIDDNRASAIYDMVVDNLTDFSFIKWHNSRRPDNQTGICFRKPKAVNFYGKSITESVRILQPYQNGDVTIDIAEIESLKNSNIDVDRHQLLNGHDFCQCLNKAIKDISRTNVRNSDIRNKLTSGFSRSDFRHTTLARSLQSSYPGILLN